MFSCLVGVKSCVCSFSALTLLVVRQEGHPACKKTEWWSAGVVICLERGADLHVAQLMPLPLTVSCSSKIQTGFTFLVPADPGSPGQRATKRVCVCVCVCKVVCVCFRLHSVQRRASSQRRAGTACHRPVRQVARLRRDSSRTVPSPNEGSCSLAVFSQLLCHTQFTESVLCHSLCHTQFTQSLLCHSLCHTQFTESLLCHSLCHTQSTECLSCENLRTVCRRCTVKPP